MGASSEIGHLSAMVAVQEGAKVIVAIDFMVSSTSDVIR